MTNLTMDRRETILRIKYRHVAAWARDVDHHFPQLLCRACCRDDADHSHDTPLDHGELCAVFVSEGSEQFPVCDGCGKDLGVA